MTIVFAISLPLVRPFSFHTGSTLIQYSDGIFLAAFLIWLAALIRARVRPAADRIYLYLCLFGVAMSVSAIMSEDPRTSLFKFLGVAYLLAIAVLTFNVGTDLVILRRLILALIAGGLLTTVGALLGTAFFYAGFDTVDKNYLLSHYGSLPSGGYPRIRSLFQNANMMCNYLSVAIVMPLAAAHLGWISRRSSYLLTSLFFVAALLTQSPGIGGTGISLGLWIGLVTLRTRRLASRLLLGAVTLLVVLVFCAALLSPDTANTDQDLRIPLTDARVESSIRVLIWQDTVKRGVERPVFGKGTGMDAASVDYRTLSGQRQHLRDAHNAWLSIFGQAGLLGLAAFAALSWHLLSICRFRARVGSETELVLIALSCAFAGSFVYQNLLGSFEDARHLWLLLGLLAAASAALTLEEGGEPTDRQPASRPL